MQTWTISWAIRNFVAELLMPPGIWLLCILLAVFLFNKRAALQKSIICFSVLMIWACSTPVFVYYLTQLGGLHLGWSAPWQENITDKSNTQFKNQHTHAAIVVLGGGRRLGALESPDYDFQDLSQASLERLRMGARIATTTKMPILLTGGAPDRSSIEDLAEADVMAKVLLKEFNLQARWLETQSQTTQENAEFTSKILKRDGVQTIYLVTHFWHMPRAQKMFEKYGLRVIPVPHGFHHSNHFKPTDFFPNALQETRQIWHEILGSIWYRIRY